jgi:DNA-3-methyladenine glycosylase I
VPVTGWSVCPLRYYAGPVEAPAPLRRCAWAEGHPLLREYHDHEYGVRPPTDAGLLELLCLELFQAGLSWLTILKKREAFRRAFEGFDPVEVAAYDDTDRARLMADARIVRNRLKIDAAIHNAGVVLELARQHGSFGTWLDAQGTLTREGWIKLFKKTFRFTGGEITNEFCMSAGYLPIRHDPGCFRAVGSMAAT